MGGDTPQNREIVQPARLVTPEVLKKIHQHPESNQDRPKKQRLTEKRIHELLRKDGYKISYSSVKQEVSDFKIETRATGSVYPSGTKDRRTSRI